MSPTPTPDLSIVVPVFDEEDNVGPLQAEIAAALDGDPRSFEVVYVDDGSRDRSRERLLELRREDPRVRVVCLTKNSGQTAAMAAGFAMSRAPLVATMDADLQNDPADIPRLLEKMEEGYDIVTGWRKKRQDGFVLRRLPSIIANRLIAWISGVRIHDTGCTLKVMRRELLEAMPFYGDQHRFLPAMSAGSGARVAEIVVNHRPRRFGTSKYGISRTLRVAVDLLTLKLIVSFTRHPGQYFGLLSLPFAALALYCAALGAWRFERLNLANEWGQTLLFALSMFVILCVYFVMLGLLAELAVKASGVHRRQIRRQILFSNLGP